MPQIIDKETHVFIKDENSFTSVAKRPIKGKYQVFTNAKLSPYLADLIEIVHPEITVKEINFEKGFLFLELNNKSNFNSIVEAIKKTIYG